MRVFKILDGLKSCHGGNHTWKLGEWFEVEGELSPCQNGIHLCRDNDLIQWLHNDIYLAEYEGEIIKEDNKVVVRKARITKHLDDWNDKSARLFACWCARQVAYLNDDPRVIACIEVAEKYAVGNATKEELTAARAAAWAGACDAALAAAWAAASAAAWAAARAAARAAALAAAWDAAWDPQTKKLLEILGVNK